MAAIAALAAHPIGRGALVGLVAMMLAGLPKADAHAARERQDWFMTFFAGQLLDERLNRILRLRASARDFQPSHAGGLGIGREIWRPLPRLAIEAEGHLVQHAGQQSHQEGNAFLLARLDLLRGNPWLHASVAVGNGLSLAARPPPVERKNDEDSGRLMNYLMVEVELDPAPVSPWSVIGRIHHRSGVFGLFAESGRGSNFVMLGLRYRP
jgi:hypothetical protein